MLTLILRLAYFVKKSVRSSVKAAEEYLSFVDMVFDMSEVYKLYMVRMTICLTNLRMKEIANCRNTIGLVEDE